MKALKTVPAVKYKEEHELRDEYGNRKPRMSKKAINEVVDKIPDDELAYTYEPRMDDSVLARLLYHVSFITGQDMHFQNLHSEVPRATKVAVEIQTSFETIKAIMTQVTEQDASMAILILRGLDYPFMRVLGDRMPFEREMKQLNRDKTLHAKASRYSLRRAILEVKIPADFELTVKNIWNQI